ncbi:TetR/AcrR family transcriptional regulator, partial [Pseudomonas aeruginosa]|nr:TetR/AcrR family transcriptional regulator [Pseudomonas aeruginosa]
EHIASSELVQSVNSTIVQSIAEILRRGEAEGVFRAGLEALDVHMLISSFCFYRVSNRYTVSRIFRTDLHDAEVRQRHRRMIGEAVLRYIRA